MATAEIQIDLSEIEEIVYEIGSLWRGGIGLPKHVVDLARELGQKEPPEDFLDVEACQGKLYVTPGPKLNVLMALLRAHRVKYS